MASKTEAEKQSTIAAKSSLNIHGVAFSSVHADILNSSRLKNFKKGMIRKSNSTVRLKKRNMYGCSSSCTKVKLKGNSNKTIEKSLSLPRITIDSILKKNSNLNNGKRRKQRKKSKKSKILLQKVDSYLKSIYQN